MKLFRTVRCRLGRTYLIGPHWLHLTWNRHGWSFYAFKRRIAWKPIDYTKVGS